MLHSWGKVILCLLVAFSHSATTTDVEHQDAQIPTENIILSSDGTTVKLMDVNARGAYFVNNGRNPTLIARLGGVFELQRIEIWGPKLQWTLHRKFNIHTHDNFINPCQFPSSTEWKLCKSDLAFTEVGQLINITCDGGVQRARYVMLSSGRPGAEHSVPGVHFGKLLFYGQKVADDIKQPMPPDEPGATDVIYEWRKGVFEGVNSLKYDAWFTSFTWNIFDDVIPLFWGPSGIMAVGANRSKGRLVSIVGETWWREMQPDSRLKQNLHRFLGKGENASFVEVDKPFKPGDIVVVKRSHKFDVNKVKEAMLSGENGLLLPFIGHRPDAFADDAAKLLLALNISRDTFIYSWGYQTVNPELGIRSTAYKPVVFHMDQVIKNSTVMRTVDLHADFNVLSARHMKTLRNEVFQKKLRALINRYYRVFYDRYPCEKHIVQVGELGMIAWWNFNQYMLIQAADDAIPLPGTHLHPGKVAPEEKPCTHRVTLVPPYDADFIATGVYANPGEKFTVRVLAHSHPLHRYRLTFGCSTDKLPKGGIARFPRLWQSIELEKEASYIPPFGGVLLLKTHGRGQNITLEFEGVYRHPWFDLLNQTSVDDWENERKRYNGVPWMMYMGDAVHLCIPTKPVVKLSKDDMVYSVTFLDNTVKMIHNFRGSRYENDRWQVFAVDVQIMIGWGHSGYPAVGYIPWHFEFTNLPQLKRQSAIGFTHEMGHNLQVRQMTLKGGIEVTNNINHFPVRGHLLNITSYGYDVFDGLTKGGIEVVVKKWLGTEYVGVHDEYYNYLGFVFGEGLLTNLMTKALAQGGRLNTEEKKVNFWLKNMCDETKYNVLPWQELWHFPITNETRTFCGQFPCFFPEDRLTEKIPELVTRQLEKYGNKCDRVPKRQVESRQDLYRSLWTVRKPFVTFV